MNKSIRNRAGFATVAVASAAAAILATAATGASAAPGGKQAAAVPAYHAKKPVKIEVFAPERHDVAGIEGKGWFVDMEINFATGTLARTGFTGLQLTGPAVHNNVPPFPGVFSTGKDDRNPGLVVLTSTTSATLPGFSGPGTNLANLFNITGVTNRTPNETELWDTWNVGAPVAGQNVDTTLTVAEVADLDHNGIFDDAPSILLDLNHDGRVDAKDLKILGVASNIVTVPFHVNGAPAS